MIVPERDAGVGGDERGEWASISDEREGWVPSRLRTLEKRLGEYMRSQGTRASEGEEGEAGVKERSGCPSCECRSASLILKAEQTRSLNSWTVKGGRRGSEESDMCGETNESGRIIYRCGVRQMSLKDGGGTGAR